MNTQFSSKTPQFQDHQLPDAAPLNSWQRLTAGDERAEHFEGLLRGALVVSLFCTVFVCGLRFRPAAELADHPRLALPTVQSQPVAGQAPTATPAALVRTVALN